MLTTFYNIYFAIFIFLLTTPQNGFTKKECDTTNDCGYGGACVYDENEKKGFCDCSVSDAMFITDSSGYCNKIEDNYCSVVPPRFQHPMTPFPPDQTVLCSRGGKCRLTFASFECVCIKICAGRYCQQCNPELPFGRFDKIYLAFSLKGKPLKNRHFLICADTFGDRIKLHLDVYRPNNIGQITALFEVGDYKEIKDARQYCLLELGIDKPVCDLIPSDRTMKCVIHAAMFPFTIHMGTKYPDPQEIFYDFKITQSLIPLGVYEDMIPRGILEYYAVAKLGFFYDNNHTCAPLIYTTLPGGVSDENLFLHISMPSTYRLNITINPACELQLRKRLPLQWKFFRGRYTFTNTYRKQPLKTVYDRCVLDVDRYSMQVRNWYKIEPWVSGHFIKNGVPVEYKNFEFGYIFVDKWLCEGIIRGGTRRTVSINTSVALDASLSFCPDTPPNQQSHLLYTWSCKMGNYSICKSTTYNSKDTLYIPFEKYESDQIIDFQLQITNTADRTVYNPVRQKIWFVDEDIPEIFIKCRKNCGSQVFSSCNRVIYLEVIYRTLASDGKTPDNDNLQWKLRRKLYHGNYSYENISLDGRRLYNTNNRYLILKPDNISFDSCYEFVVLRFNDEKKVQAIAAYHLKVKMQMVENANIAFDKANPEGTHYRFYINLMKNAKDKVFGKYFLEYYQSSDGVPDVIFLSNLYRTAGYVPVFSSQIKVLVCNTGGDCFTLNTEVQVADPSFELLESMEKDVHVFYYQFCSLDDALMNMLYVNHYLERFGERAVPVVNRFIDIIVKLQFHFARDSRQFLTILTRLMLKRDSFIEKNRVSMEEIGKIMFFLKRVAHRVSKDASFAYALQGEYDEDIFKDIARYMIKCLAVLMDWRKIDMQTVDNRIEKEKIWLESAELSEITVFLINTATYICGRHTYYYEPAVILHFRNVHFFHNVTAVRDLANSPFPPYDHSAMVRLKLTKECAESLDKIQEFFLISVAIFSNDPLSWKIEDEDVYFSHVIFVSISVPLYLNGRYKTDIITAVTKYFFKIAFYYIEPKITIFTGNATLVPRNVTDEDELDKSVVIYKIRTSGWKNLRVLLTVSVLDEGSELAVKCLSDVLPDHIFLTENPDKVVSNSSKQSLSFDTKSIFNYIGLMAKNGNNGSVRYSVEATTYGCMSWEFDRFQTYYCEVGEVIEEKVICYCHHFSAFTATATSTSAHFVPFCRSLPVLALEKTMWVYYLLCNLPVIFFVLFLILFFWDWRDRLLKFAIILEDCIPGERHPYLIAVYTGNKISCGTSSTVGFQVHGTEGESNVHILKCSWRKVLHIGSDDWFVFFTNKSLGEIEHLELWHDFTGKCPSWYCRQIIIFDLYNYKEYVFLVESWMTIYLKEDSFLYYDLNVATEDEIRDRFRLFQNNAIYSLRDGHLVNGILYGHPRSSFVRHERWIVFYMLVTVYMFVSLCFHHGFDST